MKGKTKLGMGARATRRRRSNKNIPKSRYVSGGIITFTNAMKRVRKRIGSKGKSTLTKAANVALHSLKTKQVARPKQRIIPIPKSGGFLPLIPLFAALSALGALGGGAAGIAKAVNDSKSAEKNLKEAQRHNRAMEAVAVGKGLYLRPYKSGLGLYLAPYPYLKNYQ